MKHFIDTNIFLRVLIKSKDKEVQQDCYSLLNLIREGKIKGVTSHVVLSEIVWTLKSFYKLPKTDAIRALNSINNLKLPIINNFDTSKTLKMYEKYNIKFIDCLIASNPEILSKETAIVSYDKDFDKIGINRKSPDEIVKQFSNNA